jgi:DNA-binding beta-propeller fold protein YncE
MWVANYSDDNVTRLSTADGRHLGTYPVGEKPIALAFDGSSIWVANQNSHNVSRLNAFDGSLRGTLDLNGRKPTALAFDGANLWVATWDGSGDFIHKLRISDGDLKWIPLVESPFALAFDGSSIWVANQFADSVTRLRETSGGDIEIVGEVENIGDSPVALAFDGANIWVANYLDGTVTKLASDGSTMGPFPVGAGPAALAFDGANVWVANAGSNDVMKK